MCCLGGRKSIYTKAMYRTNITVTMEAVSTEIRGKEYAKDTNCYR